MHVSEYVGTIIKIVYLVKLITFIFCVDLATFNSLTLKKCWLIMGTTHGIMFHGVATSQTCEA